MGKGKLVQALHRNCVSSAVEDNSLIPELNGRTQGISTIILITISSTVGDIPKHLFKILGSECLLLFHVKIVPTFNIFEPITFICHNQMSIAVIKCKPNFHLLVRIVPITVTHRIFNYFTNLLFQKIDLTNLTGRVLNNQLAQITNLLQIEIKLLMVH